MIDMLSSTAAIWLNWSRFVPFFSLSSETMHHQLLFSAVATGSSWSKPWFDWADQQFHREASSLQRSLNEENFEGLQIWSSTVTHHCQHSKRRSKQQHNRKVWFRSRQALLLLKKIGVLLFDVSLDHTASQYSMDVVYLAELQWRITHRVLDLLLRNVLIVHLSLGSRISSSLPAVTDTEGERECDSTGTFSPSALFLCLVQYCKILGLRYLLDLGSSSSSSSTVKSKQYLVVLPTFRDPDYQIAMSRTSTGSFIFCK